MVRLDRLRELTDFHALLTEFDAPGLLAKPAGLAPAGIETLDDEDLLAELGAEAIAAEDDITTLRHVKPRQEVRAVSDRLCPARVVFGAAARHRRGRPITNQTITDYEYDPSTESLVQPTGAISQS